MNLRKTKHGYFGYYKGYFVWIDKAMHGGYRCGIGRGNKYLATNGFHGKCFETLKEIHKYVKSTIKEKDFWHTIPTEYTQL